jgi:predicted RecB family nuclease
MQRSQNSIIYSPQDLIQFQTSKFAIWMDRWKLEPSADRTIQPEEADEMIEALQQLGQEHEKCYLDSLLNQGLDICQIEDRTDFEATLQAMKDGRAFLYQGALRHENFLGYPDFLVRVEQPSDLGSWSYIPLECKLALNPKPDSILQAASYCDLLHQIQGIRPAEFRLLLGNQEQQSFATEQYIYWFYQVQKSFLEFLETFDPKHPPVPNPGDHGCWNAIANQRLLEIDHLSQIANITRMQIRRLEDTGINTVQQLTKIEPDQKIPHLDTVILQRLVQQARLQKASLSADTLKYQIISPNPENPQNGLALLPPSSPLDVYFDIEGYPLVKGGLEYLLGVVYFNRGKRHFKDWWAHNSQMEKAAFESFIDWVWQRWRQDPTMHIYHYAPYETTAIKSLMSKYGTREAQVDEMLRSEVFVDLYQIVRQSLRVGTTSYSIKYLEPLYGRQRQESVKNAVDSVVQYFRWTQIQDGDTPASSAILRGIRDYNQVDCESTQELANWLRQLQQETGIVPIFKAQPELLEDIAEKPAAQLAKILLSELTEPAPLQQLLAYLLQFHQREAKPFWWKRFAWLQMDETELWDEPDCIAGLTRTTKPPYRLTTRSRSWVYEYQFDPSQELRIFGDRNCWFVPEELQKFCSIKELDTKQGKVLISISDKSQQQFPDWEPPQHTSLIEVEPINTKSLEQAILEIVQDWHTTKTLPSALQDLLARHPPRLKTRSSSPTLIPANMDLLTGTQQIVAQLDNSLLCIQGPPGSGKTYTAAHTIIYLIEQGKTIAISANSHQAIANLMLKVAQIATEQSISVKALKIGGEEDAKLKAIECTWKKDFKSSKVNDYLLVGATPFQFCKSEVIAQWDYLFVDEAGQMSLANLVAISRCAANIVLMGDQMQLEQPIQATHPGESGQSALGYFLNGKATIPPDIGIFLDTSYRMHPSICQFISESIYENRLQHHPNTKHHALQISPSNSNSIHQQNGILYIPVEHQDNSQRSIEEVQVIDQLIDALTGKPYITQRKPTLELIKPQDILVIAPYNLQVNFLKERLGDRARIGTVDKFQGQEAPVLILSMCASSEETIPRGIDFLLNSHRLNVAISRAQCLSIVVGSPALSRASCRSIEEISLVNLFCKLLDRQKSLSKVSC